MLSMRGVTTIVIVAGLLIFPVITLALVRDIDAVNENGRILDTFTIDQDIYISGE